MTKQLSLQLTLFISQYLLASSNFQRNSNYDRENQKVTCPTGCNRMACGMGILTCTESGLTELPKILPRNITKVLMISQDFSQSSTLSKENFTEYRSPEHNITKITIQNCLVEEIRPGTFNQLSFLEVLDLSINKIKVIQPKTFNGLNLVFLRLDRNLYIKLSPSSFQGLQVSSLSLIECNLTDISYGIFEPIASSLKRLMLSKNQIKTLESKFDNFFINLEIVSLEDNRFDCSQCSLFWLIGSMRSKVLKNIEIQKILLPRCYVPFRLKDKWIHDLVADDLQCPKHTVHRISISILPNNSAALTCTASDQLSQVVWTQLFSANKTMPYPTSDIQLSQSLHSNHLLVEQRQPVDIFSCTVTNPRGNYSSTKLQISWPKIRQKPSNNDADQSRNQAVTKMPNDSSSKHYFFQPQFSLIEMIAGVIGTFIGTLLLFIAMLRCIFYRMQFCTKDLQLRDHQLSLTSSKKDKMKHYMTYEPPLYSDSQTYDVTSLSPKVNQSSVGHFIDFKTQQTLFDRND